MDKSTKSSLGKNIVLFSLLVLILTAIPLQSRATSTVVTFGDSITSGYPYQTSDGNGCVNCGGYQWFLQNYLNWSGYDMTVYNYGVRGEFTWDGLVRIDSVMAATAANYVLIMEGTNDLTFYVDPSTVAYYVYYLAWKVVMWGGIPILATITPDTRQGIGYDWKGIGIANAWIKYFVAENSYICGSDQYTAIEPYWDIGYNYDGLHPNWYGYWMMGAMWFYDLTDLKNCSYWTSQ